MCKRNPHLGKKGLHHMSKKVSFTRENGTVYETAPQCTFGPGDGPDCVMNDGSGVKISGGYMKEHHELSRIVDVSIKKFNDPKVWKTYDEKLARTDKPHKHAYPRSTPSLEGKCLDTEELRYKDANSYVKKNNGNIYGGSTALDWVLQGNAAVGKITGFRCDHVNWREEMQWWYDWAEIVRNAPCLIYQWVFVREVAALY